MCKIIQFDTVELAQAQIAHCEAVLLVQGRYSNVAIAASTSSTIHLGCRNKHTLTSKCSPNEHHQHGLPCWWAGSVS